MYIRYFFESDSSDNWRDSNPLTSSISAALNTQWKDWEAISPLTPEPKSIGNHLNQHLKLRKKTSTSQAFFSLFFIFFTIVARLDAVRTNKSLTNTPKLCTF